MSRSSSLRVLLIAQDSQITYHVQQLLESHPNIELKCASDPAAALQGGVSARWLAADYDVALLVLDWNPKFAHLSTFTHEAATVGATSVTLPPPHFQAQPDLTPIREWRRHAPYIPLVVIADCPPPEWAGEDVALEALRAGAQDCLSSMQLTTQTLIRSLHAAQARHCGALGINDAQAAGTQSMIARVLATSKAHMRTIIESESQCVTLVSVDGTVLDMNPAGLRFLEADNLEQIINRPILELIHPEDQAAFTALHRRVTQGENGQLQFRITGCKGNYRWMDAHSAPLHNNLGRITGVLSVIRDITDQREDDLLREIEKTILALITSNRPLAEVLDRIMEGVEALCPGSIASIFMVDGAGKTLQQSFSAHLPRAYTQALVGLPIGPKAGSCGTAAWRRERVIVGDIDTDPLWAEYRSLAQFYGLAACWATPILGETGVPIASFAVYYKTPRVPQGRQLEHLDRLADLAGIALERARTQHALQASEERFRQVFQLAAVGIGVTSLEGNFLHVNAAYCEMLGYSREEMQQLNFSEVTHPDDRWDSLDHAQRLRAREIDRYTLEKRYIHKAGHLVWVRLSVARLEDSTGKLVGHIAVAEDITQAKEAESALLHSQGLMRAASRLGKLGGWAVDLPVNKMYWSDEVCLMHDMPLGSQLSAEEASKFYTPQCRVEINDAFETCLSTGEPFDIEIEGMAAKGRPLWVRINGEPVRDQHGRIVRVQGALQDISERKAAEQSLRQSNERFKLLARATHDIIWDWDVTGKSIWWNENVETVFGYEPETDIPNFESWLELVHQNDQQRLQEAYERSLTDAHCNFREDEYRFLRKDGRIAHVLDRAAIIRDEKGQAVRLVGGMSDITERKQLETQILRAQRLESLGTLAGGIAHDLNNILTPILLAAFLLKNSVESEQARKQLEIIEETAGRGADMVRQVLTFARGSSGQQLPVEIDRVAQEVVKLMQDTLDKNIRILLNIAAVPWHVLGDSTQIHQVLVNLCVNARDAMPNGGTLEIKVENLEVDQQFASMVPQAIPGSYVRLTITDSGIGMPKEIQELIFDPFFTTKPTGKGTGLGLSTVQGIMRGHNGFITVYSKEKLGTTFNLYFPAMLADKAVPATLPAAAIPGGEGELILVVDDEKPLRLITQQTLEMYGYRVLLAEDGAQAVSLYVQHRQEIALVMTDMMMPVMDGLATIQALYRINPEIKIVGASGMAAAGLAAKAARLGVVHFLTKPYTAELVVRTLAEALGKV